MKRTREAKEVQTEEELKREAIEMAPVSLAAAIGECRVRCIRNALYGPEESADDYVNFVKSNLASTGELNIIIPYLFQVTLMDEGVFSLIRTRWLFRARPSWWPSWLCTSALSLHFLSLVEDQQLTRLGAGHAVISMMEQLVAGLYGEESFEKAHVDYCHFATFYTLDGHYNWDTMVKVNRAGSVVDLNTADFDTPPLHLYQRYLNTAQEMQRSEVRNALSKYGPVDLVWSPPQQWFEARLENFWDTHDERMNQIGKRLWEACALDALKTFIATTLFHPVRSGTSDTVQHEREHGAFGTIRLRAGTFADLRTELGSPATQALIGGRLIESCLQLGNADVSSFPSKQAHVDREYVWRDCRDEWTHRDSAAVRIVLLDRLSFNTALVDEGVVDTALSAQIQKEGRALMRAAGSQFMRLFLALLVDMCRVFYRPLVLTKEVVRTLGGKLCLGGDPGDDDGHYLLGATDEDRLEMPSPLPYFIKREDDGTLIYMPRRRPHTTDWKTGATYTPVPLLEPPLTYESAATSPPERAATPRGVKFEASCCDHCRATAPGFHDGVFAFCGAMCQELYYRGEQ